MQNLNNYHCWPFTNEFFVLRLDGPGSCNRFKLKFKSIGWYFFKYTHATNWEQTRKYLKTKTESTPHGFSMVRSVPEKSPPINLAVEILSNLEEKYMLFERHTRLWRAQRVLRDWEQNYNCHSPLVVSNQRLPHDVEINVPSPHRKLVHGLRVHKHYEYHEAGLKDRHSQKKG